MNKEQTFSDLIILIYSFRDPTQQALQNDTKITRTSSVVLGLLVREKNSKQWKCKSNTQTHHKTKIL